MKKTGLNYKGYYQRSVVGSQFSTFQGMFRYVFMIKAYETGPPDGTTEQIVRLVQLSHFMDYKYLVYINDFVDIMSKEFPNYVRYIGYTSRWQNFNKMNLHQMTWRWRAGMKILWAQWWSVVAHSVLLVSRVFQLLLMTGLLHLSINLEPLLL